MSPTIISENMNQTHEATVGQRGQIVIPKPIREAASINPGATLQFSFIRTTIEFTQTTGSCTPESDSGRRDEGAASHQ